MVLLPDPELERAALLHVPHLVGPPEGGVQVDSELEPLAVVSDLPADIDQQNVVLAAVFPHVHLPGGFLALTAGGPGIVLGVRDQSQLKAYHPVTHMTGRFVLGQSLVPQFLGRAIEPNFVQLCQLMMVFR